MKLPRCSGKLVTTTKAHVEVAMRKHLQTLLLSLAVVGLLSPSVATGGSPTSYIYLYPAVAKVHGAAGTDWRTEVCITNLADRDQNVRIIIGLDSGTTWRVPVIVQASETNCYEDVIGQKFPMQNFTGWLSIAAFPDDNYGHDEPLLSASVRIYNFTETGTYGQEIPPVDPFPLFGGYLFAGTASGLSNNTDFRTNIGLLSMEGYDWQTVDLWVFDKDGYEVYQLTDYLAPLAFYQFRLPPEVWLTSGTILLASEGAFSGYVSVVDNRTGDGLCRIPLQLDLSEVNGLLKARLPEGVPSRSVDEILSTLIARLRELSE